MDRLKFEITIPESVYQAFEQRCIAIADKVFTDKLREIQKERVKLTRAEAAKILKISLPTLDKHLQDGVIRSQRVGKRVLIPDDQLEQFLNRGR